MEEEEGNQSNVKRQPIFRDIRRYYCEFCGICRSKKTLITSHIISHHQDEMKEKGCDEDAEKERPKLNKCEQCDITFKKPAHLKQHMQSHSFERPFTCPVEDCQSSYRRKDHLNRHLLQHKGKLFECPVDDCKSRFTVKGNIKRHLDEFHNDEDRDSVDSPSDAAGDGQKQFVCPESGCGKVFKYASKLRKHEDSHVKLDTVEVFCSEPGCLKYFTNEQYLRDHLQSCHQHINCEICGSKYLKKNIKRHLRTHDPAPSEESEKKVECSYEGCSRTFSTNSNLRQHIKAVHLEEKPFACSLPGCDMRFSFKHVRDNHEKSACHVYTPGDFLETDEQFQSVPRGGRKRTLPSIDTLMRKRIVPPSLSDSVLDESSDFLSWMLSGDSSR